MARAKAQGATNVVYLASKSAWNWAAVRMCPCFWASIRHVEPELGRPHPLAGRAVMSRGW